MAKVSESSVLPGMHISRLQTSSLPSARADLAGCAARLVSARLTWPSADLVGLG